MNCKFILVLGLAFAAVVAFAAPKPEQPWQKAEKVKKGLMGQRNVSFAEIVDRLEALRGETEYATNAFARAHIDKMRVELCRTQNWTSFSRWDKALRTKVPSIVKRNLEDDEVGFGQKIALAAYLAEYLSSEQHFAEAEQTIKGVMASAVKRTPREETDAWLALADVYRWQDRFEDAWMAVEKAFDGNHRSAIGKAYVLADATGDEPRVEAMAERIANPYEKIDYLRQNERTRPVALAFVRDPKMPPAQRASVVGRWFAADDTPMGASAREAIKGIDMSKINMGWISGWRSPIRLSFWYGDWAKVERIFATFEGAKGLDDPANQRIRLFARAANGDRAGALALAKANLAKTDLKPMDRAKLEVSVAILSGGDVEKAIAATGLGHKETVELTCIAARQALNWGYGELAEKLTAKHAAYFIDFPQREIKVNYSEKPIESIADWRAVYEQLDRQLCDRVFKANLDALETDVATGRQIGEKTALDSKEVMMEVSAICDAKGLHIFLHVNDPAARAVEAGFAGGIGTELYFAPGKYEPYVCFGTDPRTGAHGNFQTQYSNIAHHQVDMTGMKRRGEFKFESSFTDTDYVEHLFIAWDANYLKLPANGSKWRFECHAFCPQGFFTLGGSGSVHNSSKWCDLTFSLKPTDITAIRRGLLYRHVKDWAKLGRLDRFDKWADEEIGDPEFYNEVLKPIEARLKGLAKEVTLDMSDADVNRIFEAALPHWLGISHEIDQLRRKWLLEKCCK